MGFGKAGGTERCRHLLQCTALQTIYTYCTDVEPNGERPPAWQEYNNDVINREMNEIAQQLLSTEY